MTIVNVIVTPDAACLITDTKAVRGDGIVFQTHKVRCLPHMRIAVAARGLVSALDRVTLALCEHATNYETAASFLDLCYGGLNLGDSEVFVAGWDNDHPAAIVISKLNTGGKVQPIPVAAATPMVPEADFDRFAADPIAGMKDLVRLQAARNSDCGGFLNVTHVGPAEIASYSVGLIEGGIYPTPYEGQHVVASTRDSSSQSVD